ncbi:MAG: hypothetical protein N4A31_03375 [Rickettsiales bacterium]|nr:hypothetical protein [Rickettsiales bacterium]
MKRNICLQVRGRNNVLKVYSLSHYMNNIRSNKLKHAEIFAKYNLSHDLMSLAKVIEVKEDLSSIEQEILLSLQKKI